MPELPPGATAALVLAAAGLWDLLLGEPWTRLHPVVWIGWAARPLLWLRRRALPPWLAFAAGAGWTAVLALGAAAASATLLRVLAPWPWLSFAVEVYLVSSLFALRALLEAGHRLARALEAGHLTAAREAVSHLCSRDPRALGPDHLASAGIESISENTHDSVVAPLFFYALGGLPALALYRVANTLDAMVGYRDDREWLGKAAARLDDLLNYIPARISAALLALCGPHPARALATLFNDEVNTPPGPNSGWPMAVTAATLEVRLEKPGHYVLGANRPPPGAAELQSALRLVRRASVACIACAIAWLAWHGGPLVRFWLT